MFLEMQAPAYIQLYLPESNHPCPNFALIITIFVQIQPKLYQIQPIVGSVAKRVKAPFL